MFKEEKFQKQVRMFPPNGMNMDISNCFLKSDSAIIMENVMPIPVGSGTVRFGTRSIYDGADLNHEGEIISKFPAYNADGDKIILFWFRHYTHEQGVLGEIAKDSFSITPLNINNYQDNFVLKIRYSVPDSKDPKISEDFEDFVEINSVTPSGKLFVIKLNEFKAPSGAILKDVWYPEGAIYKYDFSTDKAIALRDHLHPHCSPCYEVYKKNTFICNGYDNTMRWDGNNLIDASDYVEEKITNVSKKSEKTIIFTCGSFVSTNYVNNTIQITYPNGTSAYLKCISESNVGTTVTLNFDSVVADFPLNGVNIFYLSNLPKFNYIKVLHDRMFGLGEGLSSPNVRSSDMCMRVFFQYKSNSLFGWFSPETKTVPSIDLSDKQGVFDNLEAISFVNGYTVFLGRKKTQIWSGTEPLGAAIDVNRQKLSHVATLNSGLMHKDLLAELPNEIIVANENGLFSFSTFNIAKQFAANPISQVTPFIKQKSGEILTKFKWWMKTKSFIYPHGGFFGFKLGDNECLVCFFDSSSHKFTFFSGDFKRASCFLDGLDNSLYISNGIKINQYGDDNTGLPAYGDNGDTDIVQFSVVLSPFYGKRWLNMYAELIVDYPSTFVLRENNCIYISVHGDLGKTFDFESKVLFPMRGDIMGAIPMVATSYNGGDYNLYEQEGQRLDVPYRKNYKRLKFPASRFYININGYADCGKVVFKALNLYGRYAGNT